MKDGLTSDGRLFMKLGEGDIVKIFLVMKILHNLQVGLQGLDFGGEVFCDLLDRFITREEVECLIDVPPENVNASELFYQLDLEGGPVNDVVERSSFSKRDGLLGESHFNIILSLGQVEPVQDGRQPGVEICRLATPGRCVQFGRFETGTRLEAVLRGGRGVSCVGGVGVDDVICGLITGLKVGAIVHEELQIGVQLVKELFG